MAQYILVVCLCDIALVCRLYAIVVTNVNACIPFTRDCVTIILFLFVANSSLTWRFQSDIQSFPLTFSMCLYKTVSNNDRKWLILRDYLTFEQVLTQTPNRIVELLKMVSKSATDNYETLLFQSLMKCFNHFLHRN